MTSPEQEQEAPVYDDDARAVAVINEYLKDGRAMRPPNLPNKRTISARVSDTAHAGLQAIARDLGYVYGGQGNVSLLLEAIGTRTVIVTQQPLQARRL